MHDNHTLTIEILQDVKNGKPRPWRTKKINSLKVASSYERLGHLKRSLRMRYCGSTLAFLVNTQTGKKLLHAANFCRERMCPMCQWRKSLKVYHEVSRVMDKAQDENPALVPVFLTLTLKNCSTDDLSNTLDAVFDGWKNLIDHRRIRKVVHGWFRALEVTYNAKSATFHPHIHAILLVDKTYFKSKEYMQTADWVRLWRVSMALDYDPICDIRKVKNSTTKHKAVAEVAKYTLKDSDFLTADTRLTDNLVGVLTTSLKGRRLYAFGGLLKSIARRLGAESPDSGDLVHIDGSVIRVDVAHVLEVYRWSFGAANYLRS